MRLVGADEPAVVEADIRRIDRIVRNLLTNAAKYSGSPVIEIEVARTTSASRSRSRLGVGLTGDENIRVFDRFWRADPARTQGGTGLGLPISREDAVLHGGSLAAWGRPGEGSEFVLTLPKTVPSRPTRRRTAPAGPHRWFARSSHDLHPTAAPVRNARGRGHARRLWQHPLVRPGRAGLRRRWARSEHGAVCTGGTVARRLAAADRARIPRRDARVPGLHRHCGPVPDARRRQAVAVVQGVTVYTSPEVSLSETGVLEAEQESVIVDLRTSPVARLDRQGHFTKGGDAKPRSFVLEKIKGQWRISNPQDGVMVTRTYYDDYFRPFSLYFFDAPGERVVPDLVHLAVGDQLPTALVTALARGPVRTPGSLRTYVPGVGSLRPSVTVGDADVADVEFSASLTRLSTGERERLAAQIVWTLRSVPALLGVRIFGGTPILTARGERVHPVDSWGGSGPPAANAHTYALVGDKLVEIDGTTVRPVKGAWGREANGAVEAAVGNASVAAVLAGRDQVRITDRGGGSRLDVDGGRFIAPQWDPDDRLWLIDRPVRSTRVRIVDRQTRCAAFPPPACADWQCVRSPSHQTAPAYALTGTDGAGPTIYVGPVHRDRDGRLTALGSPRRLAIGVAEPRSVGWVSAARIGFLGASDAGVQRYEVAYDGTDLTGGDTGGGPILPDVDAAFLAGRTGENAGSLGSSTAGGRLWYLPPDGSWRLVDDRRFSGLSTGD